MARSSLFSLERPQRRLVFALVATTMLLWVGGSAMLPLLPVYLRHNGSAPGLIGIVMAGYFAASVATQYPAGKLSDRVGCRPVVVVGLAIFAVGSLGFALTSGAGAAISFRALQGIGAGSVTVAAAAMIGAEIDVAMRGRAFGALYGSQMLALAVGPLAGSLVGGTSIRLLFVIAAGAAVVASVPILAVGGHALGASARRAGEGRGGATGAVSHRTPVRLRSSPALIGTALVFAGTGLLAGVYESSWSLLLHLRHASTLDIGLSWTLFALPFALLSVPAGRLAERANRRVLALGALVSSSAFAALYPFLHDVRLLVGLGCLEATGAVVGTPAAVLVLSETVPSTRQGAAQGAVETARMATTALAAAGSGALFAVDPVVPFAIGAGVTCLLAAATWRAWRDLPSSARAAAGRRGEPLASHASWGPGYEPPP